MILTHATSFYEGKTMAGWWRECKWYGGGGCCVQQLLNKNDNGYETGSPLNEGDLLSLAERWKISDRDVTLAGSLSRGQPGQIYLGRCRAFIKYCFFFFRKS